MALNYTEEELNLLANTPPLIGTAMAFAGNSGLFGTGKEMYTSAQSVIAGSKDYPNNALIQAVLPDIQGDAADAVEKMKKIRDWGVARLKAKGVTSAEQFQEIALEDCKEVMTLLAAKATAQEADEYKHWALSIAEKVAMSASEGGFLGFGGERFSTNEKQFLDQLEKILHLKSSLTSQFRA